jgi:hypothetical protein
MSRWRKDSTGLRRGRWDETLGGVPGLTSETSKFGSDLLIAANENSIGTNLRHARAKDSAVLSERWKGEMED